MMKRWPPLVVEEAHAALVAQWNEKHIPEWWRWKWLAPLPKTKDTLPSLADLRPLCLLEALRKVWTKIVLARITSVWSEHAMLHESQHGSVHGRGTASASLQHINDMEEAVELGVPMHRSSWDMSRAFDTLSHTVKMLCWVRMGVPLEIAEYLVGMDTPGINIVRSPLASRTWSKYGYNGFQGPHSLPDYLRDQVDLLKFVAIFVAARGTGQGDNPSPTLWASFTDILCRVLASLGMEQGFEVREENGDLTLVIETMYVDDMESKTATAAGMQRRADIIAAFAMIFGIKFSEKKFRRGVMNEPLTRDTPESMTIRGPGWQSIEVPIRREGATDYLGIPTDLDYSGQALMEKLVSLTREACQAIRSAKASPETKLMVATSSVLAKLKYKAILGALPLSAYRAIDKEFKKFYRSITKNLPTFPTDLLYCARSHGSLGIRKFSDEVQ